jgi:ABC-type transport system involved in multi-copper enzyme maturation permease subunit
MITQTLAIFLEAYRELNAKKMFWIVLGLSLLCVAVLACIGIYDNGQGNRGFTILIWKFPVQIFDVIQLDKRLFYNLLFFNVGFKIWLTWAATILALISTAGVIPDFISGGAVEMSLSKPIGRLRLFLTKYLAGLTFVVLQVSIFAAASFIVIGLRSGAWQPTLFLAVPIVVAFFSYLYGFMVLLGMLTRSAIASLLITIVLWLGIFALHVAEAGPLLEAKFRQDQAVAIREDDLNKLTGQAEAKRSESQAETVPESGSEGSATATSATRGKTLAQLESEITEKQARLDEYRADQKRLTNIHALLFATKTILPKTSETMELLQRSLVSAAELEGIVENTPEPPRRRNRDPLAPSETSVRKAMEIEIRSRSVGWVLGTSLLFEAVVVAAAAFIFCRRDF